MNINKRQNVEIHEFVIMPNHVHIIICLSNCTHDMNIGYRRDGLVGRPQNDGIVCGRQNDGIVCGRATSASLQEIVKHENYTGPLLGNIINSFKLNITKYANANNIPFARQ